MKNFISLQKNKRMKERLRTKNFIAEAIIKRGFKDSYAEIKSVSGKFSLKVEGRPFLMLWKAIEHKDGDFIESYGQLVYMTTTLIGHDTTFDNDLVVALNAWQTRIEDKAKENAAKVTDIDEETDNRLMRDAIDIAEGGEKVRKAKADELRQQISEVRNDG